LSDLTLILLSAGNSSRFGMNVKKQWLRIDHNPLWQFVTKRLSSTGLFSDVIVTAHADEVSFMKYYGDFTIVEGGRTRQESLRNALSAVKSKYVIVTDIARACIDPMFIRKLIDHREKADCIVPFLSMSDTVVYKDNTIERSDVKRIQTPQLSNTESLRAALQSKTDYTDESSAIVANGGSRYFIEGHEDAHKITYLSDLKAMPCLHKPSSDMLVGNGFDVHAFDKESEMVLGGVNIDVDFGFKAHSDGDVAIHALIDALLGAAGMGDIGMLFPDTDNAYKNIDSKGLLRETVVKIRQFGYEIVNADVTIMAQVPRLDRYKIKMRKALSAILQIEPSRMNIKATTTEKLGFVGRKEGVGVIATAALKGIPYDVVLLSTNISGQDYYSVIEAYKDSVVILMVSYISNDTVSKPLDTGAKDYILKPFMIEELIRKIEHFQEFEALKRQNKMYKDYLRHSLDGIKIEHDLENIKLPLFISSNFQKYTDLFVFSYAELKSRPMSFVSFKNSNALSEIASLPKNTFVYINDFQAIKKSDRRPFLDMIADMDVIVSSSESIEDVEYRVIEIKSDNNIFEQGDILPIEDYVKYIVLNYQHKFPDTELSKKLGISRKSLWEKRKKYGIIKKK